MAQHNLYDHDQATWDRYVKGRPPVPDSFFATIFDYHAKHNGQFGTVHDAGCGPGLHSPRLASRFDKVTLSDPSEQNIQLARSWLRSTQYSFSISKLDSHNPDIATGSLDMLFAGTMMHFTNLDKAIDEISRQLKPGGTFCATLCGRLCLREPRLKDIHDRLFVQSGRNMMASRKGPWEQHKPSLMILASAYDMVPLPETVFQPGAQRMQINMGANTRELSTFAYPPELREDVWAQSKVGPDDEVVARDDPDWCRKVNIQDIADNIATISLGLDRTGGG